MKATRTMVLIVMIASPYLALSQSGDLESQVNLSKAFIEAIIDGTATDAEIIDQYLLVHESGESVEFTKVLLQSVRKSTKENSIDKSNLTFHTYSKSGVPELMVSESEKPRVVIIKHKGKYLMPVLFKDGRINSFATMDKGTRQFFLLL